MPIAFACQSCGRSLRVKDQLAGAQIYCPDCKSILTVPSADDAVPTPVDEPYAPPPVTEPLEPHDEMSARAELPLPPPPPPLAEEFDEEDEEPIAPKYPPMRKGPNLGAVVGGLAMLGAGVIFVMIGLATGIWIIKLIVILFIAGIVTFIKGLVGSSD